MTFLFGRFGGNLGIKFCLQGVKGNHLCHSCIALLMDYTQDAIVHLGCICNDMNQVIKIFRNAVLSFENTEGLTNKIVDDVCLV